MGGGGKPSGELVLLAHNDAARSLLPDPSHAIDEPSQEPLVHTLARWAKKTPNRVAIEYRGGRCTFGELEERGGAIRASLRARGLSRGARVVVTGERTPGVVAAMVALWGLGAVVVPLGDNLPEERRRLVAREAEASLFIVAGADATDWGVPVLRIDPDTGRVSGEDAGAVPAMSTSDEAAAAYVFFTSGTTGKPKGVLGTHKGLAHFIRWQCETFGITPEDRAAQLTGLSFDVVLRDMFMPLSAGATLAFPRFPAESLESLDLFDWLREARITVLHSVPSVLETWFGDAGAAAPLEGLRLLFVAGEPLSDILVRRCRAHFPHARIINLYGPTETTLAKCFFEVPREPTPGIQPVGSPLPETQALVVSDAGALCALGETGEIVIRTPFRTLGYLHGDDGSPSRFRKNPFRHDPNDIVYFTGDRGRRRLDGQLEIVGRLDDEVKIHGVRVQPGEVAAALRTHPSIATVFVKAFLPTHIPNANKALVAYVVPARGAHLAEDDLRRHLAALVPSAMVPAVFVFLERMPLNASGKVDRKALPDPDPPGGGYVEPRNLLEKQLCGLFAEVLGVPRVGIHDNFWALGGHSLFMTRLLNRIRSTLGLELSPRVVFESPTVALLAAQQRPSGKTVEWVM